MKKLILLTAILLICISGVNGALVGSEDFQNYTAQPVGVTNTFNNSLFLTESGNRWHCANPTYTPYCAQPINSAVAIGALGNFTVFSYLGNQWMRLWAVGGDATNYYTTDIYWNYTALPHEDVIANTVWTKQFRIRLVYDNWGSLTGTAMRAGYGGEESTFGGSLCGGASCYVEMKMGQIYTATEANYTSLRGFYLTSTSEMRPPTGFDMSDTNWHYITEYYHINSTCDYTYVEQYIDGVLFENITINHNYACGDTWAPNLMEFKANKVFSYDIDDLAIYDDQEPLFMASTNETAPSGCDECSPPCYLKESFNGYLSDCEWFTTHSIYNNGQLSLLQAQSPYVQSKAFGPITEGMSQYITLKFDLNINTIETDNFVDIRLYDQDYKNFWIFYIGGSPTTVYTTKAGVSTAVTTINYSQTYSYKIVVDLSTQTYDAYINNVLVADNFQFSDALQPIDSVYFFKFASLSSQLQLDNIYIYTSDGTGNALTPSTTIPTVNNATKMCGLFLKTTPSCTADSECVSGDCMPNGRCNSFDMTYCDEHGLVRGNKCIAGAIASCTFSSISSVAFDNFEYVLIGLLILVAVTYFSIMLRRRGQ
jgi:hypothetical protein